MLLALWPAIMPMLDTQVKDTKRIIYPMTIRTRVQIEQDKKKDEEEILLFLM